MLRFRLYICLQIETDAMKITVKPDIRNGNLLDINHTCQTLHCDIT
jgi:hypothetical protein